MVPSYIDAVPESGKLEESWNMYKNREGKDQFLKCLIHNYKTEIFICFLGQTLNVVLQMADPFVIKALVEYFQDPEAHIMEGILPAALYVISDAMRRKVGDIVSYY